MRSYTRKAKTSNKRVSCTRRALSIILAEVDPVEVAEMRRVGLLGWDNALAMKPRRGSFRPRRACASSGVQSRF